MHAHEVGTTCDGNGRRRRIAEATLLEVRLLRRYPGAR